MKKRLGLVSIVTILVMALLTLSAFASGGRVYLSSDKNGQNLVWDIQEGDSVFIVVDDGDENIDCDVRDKFWTDIKLIDPKTGAYLDWESWGPAATPVAGYVGRDGSTTMGNFMEETGANTGLFVSNVPFQVGTRLGFTVEQDNTHWVGRDFDGLSPAGVQLFSGHFYAGNWEYLNGTRTETLYQNWYSAPLNELQVMGRFENMDSLIVMYQDPNDPKDVAVGMAKIKDTEATIEWDAVDSIYKDGNGSATITITDADENLNCNLIEYVPVFVIVNPGSWNMIQTGTANDFCTLKRTGGINPAPASVAATLAVPGLNQPINWTNIYNSGLTSAGVDLAAATAPVAAQPDEDGSYYIQYPNNNTFADLTYDGRGSFFDTRTFNGETRVSFYAQETSVNSGVFQLNLNSILLDLGFNTLNVGDVLVAYYLDPNDEDDFVLATAYIESKEHISSTRFTDASMNPMNEFWIGRDPVYVQVIDGNANVDPCCPETVIVKLCDVHEDDDVEFLEVEERSSNTPVFFTNAGMELDSVWDAMGVGTNVATTGGFQLVLDNWTLEVYNEDTVYARYNDVYYFATTGIGDQNQGTAFPPTIERVRVYNDVSFDTMKITDTQVAQAADQIGLAFLNREGAVVTDYVNSDCVFIQVTDPDQDEDQYRRERIDAYWDGKQNAPFGPIDWDINHAVCGVNQNLTHPINHLLGDTNIFSGAGTSPVVAPERAGIVGQDIERYDTSRAKLYVMNPRNGHWAPVDLLETATNSGVFVSVICIDLTSVYTCVPSLGILPGDTIVAFYQDPSNHSDSAMVSIKVGIGGSNVAPPVNQQSSTMFVDADGVDAGATIMDSELVYVKVVDPSKAGETTLVVEIDGVEYTMTQSGASDTFMTEGLDLGLTVGQELEAVYVDPSDSTDTSSDTITVVEGALDVDSFFFGPNPFVDEVTFGFDTGTAEEMTVVVYNLAGDQVWTSGTQFDVSEITWDGAGLANGAYLYVVTTTDGTGTLATQTGKVFINR